MTLRPPNYSFIVDHVDRVPSVDWRLGNVLRAPDLVVAELIFDCPLVGTDWHGSFCPVWPRDQGQIDDNNEKNIFHALQKLRMYPSNTYYWTVPLLLDYSYLVGILTNLKISETKSFRTSKILTLLYQQFLNLLISLRDMNGPRLGTLSNNRWSGVRSLHPFSESPDVYRQKTNR